MAQYSNNINFSWETDDSFDITDSEIEELNRAAINLFIKDYDNGSGDGMMEYTMEDGKLFTGHWSLYKN